MNGTSQPKEAALIEQLRQQRLPRLSIAKAAKAAGISEGRWRQIAKGYQQATHDTRVPVRAPADTLARMARVVGATAEQLEQVGRRDAAIELQRPAQVDVVLSEVSTGVLWEEIERRLIVAGLLDESQRGTPGLGRLEALATRDGMSGEDADKRGQHRG